MFLTNIHLAGGSTVEAAEPFSVLGPYSTEQEAKQAAQAVFDGVKHVDFLKEECFFIVLEIPDSPQDPNTTVNKLLERFGDE